MRPDSGRQSGHRVPAVVTDRDLAECEDPEHYKRLVEAQNRQLARDPNANVHIATPVKGKGE